MPLNWIGRHFGSTKKPPPATVPADKIPDATQRILGGQSNPQICEEMGIECDSVRNLRHGLTGLWDSVHGQKNLLWLFRHGWGLHEGAAKCRNFDLAKIAWDRFQEMNNTG